MSSGLKLGPRIGHGFFGDVFEAEDSIHGKVAVKVPRRFENEPDAAWKARKACLVEEGQRLSKADHQNVVRVYYHDRDPQTNDVRLVMQFCEGGSFQERYEQGPIPLPEVRKIATDIALGLSALHDRGMLHRDIKPGNLLKGEAGVGKLGDFGLVTDNIVLGYASQAGYSDHLAYEIWQGAGSSVRSDIWALGMTLYRLIHGNDWYTRSPAPRVIISNGGFADRLTWLPHVPKRWRTMLRKMMSDDPHKRCQNVQQVLKALAKCETINWRCDVGDNTIRWELCKGERIVRVVKQQDTAAQGILGGTQRTSRKREAKALSWIKWRNQKRRLRAGIESLF
jgi:serine/threonine-protein kinase